jgi:hypothetical protein
MKTHSSFPRSHAMLGAAALAAFSLLSLAPSSYAKDKGGKGNNGHGMSQHPEHGNSGKGSQGNNGNGNSNFKGNQGDHGNPHHDHDHDQQVYHAHPGAKFQLNKGNGHAGPGYYYGPPNAPYYYARPGVNYYPNHGAIPSQYRNQNAYRMNSDDYRVQQALARLGYYNGSIDGQFGPQSYRALNRYQQSQGMSPSNAITAALLRALGL